MLHGAWPLWGAELAKPRSWEMDLQVVIGGVSPSLEKGRRTWDGGIGKGRGIATSEGKTRRKHPKKISSFLVLNIADAVRGWIQRIKKDDKKGLQKEDEKAVLN